MINFGKYKGYKVIDILAKDPYYIKWALENTRSFPSQELLDILKEKNIIVNRKRKTIKSEHKLKQL